MIFSDKRFFCKWMITILVIGFVMRAVLGYLSEYNNDVTAWTMTLSNIESGSGLYNEAGYYYPPVWGYILGTFSGFLGLFGVDSWADIFTDLLFVEDYEDAMVSTPAFNIALTVLLTIADLISSYAIYWIVMHLTGDMIKAKMGFSIYFILPHMIFQTAGYGQFDPISAMMTLLCVCLLLRGDDFLAGMMFVLAVLLKFFPVFLFFIFIAYIIVKRGEEWKSHIVYAITGGILMGVILYLPQLLEGTLLDSMTFVTARMGDDKNVYASLLKYSSIVIYSIILIVQIYAARYFRKNPGDDIDSNFLWMTFVSLIVLFLYPSTPQYIVLLTPFLIISMLVHEEKLLKPTLLLTISCTVFMLSSAPMLLTTSTMYMGLIPFDTWLSLYHFTYDPIVWIFTNKDLITLIGAAGQYLSVVWMGVYALRHLGIDIRAMVHRAQVENQ